MLKHLEIKNYALIDHVDLDFDSGLTIITGETGAGKSILLGGMELILGKRAQQGLLKNKEKKSIVEAEFDIANYNLKYFFEDNELDYEKNTIIRRELLPGGKSRAFVNDTPVRLEILSLLTQKIIDIHSQHQTLELNKRNFQFELLDALADNHELFNKYQELLQKYKESTKKIIILEEKLSHAQDELEYKSFQLEELKQAKLDEIHPEELEQRLKLLENAEEIGVVLQEALERIDREDLGIHTQLIELRNAFQRISSYGNNFQEIAERLESVQIELADISMEISKMTDENEFEPFEKENLKALYDEYHRLLLKHKVSGIEDLINLREQLESEVSDLSDLEEKIGQAKLENEKLKKQLQDLAKKLSVRRQKAIPLLTNQIQDVLKRLSMSDTRIKIELLPQDEFTGYGLDDIHFLISSDKGKSFGEIKQIASGGELSRIMLAVKTVLSKYKKLPTIIFDEIDTGISGEVAQNMAKVLKDLSENMQVIVITHLPQIAAAGDKHYKVYKENEDEINTKVKILDNESRIYEIAEMIEGKNPSDSALQHARHLLG
jgi:DNA repair protein RecN (Recombination protein N)